jgi:hypothetical protein
MAAGKIDPSLIGGELCGNPLFPMLLWPSTGCSQFHRPAILGGRGRDKRLTFGLGGASWLLSRGNVAVGRNKPVVVHMDARKLKPEPETNLPKVSIDSRINNL